MRPRHKILLLAVLLLAACSPLRRTQHSRKADSTAVDRTEIRRAVHDILRESGTLSQTVVEFYPPVVSPVAAPEVGRDASRHTPPGGVAPQEAKDVWRPSPLAPTQRSECGAALPATEPSATQPPAVRRIVHTEIAAELEQETSTDSLANNDIHTTTHTELSNKVAEKPPATTTTIKWIAIALAAVAAIFLLLKIPKIKL